MINTSTTIITFLMVFLIQNTQNRDTAAMQIKLAELILRLDGADNKLATAEDLSDEDLERLHRRISSSARNDAGIAQAPSQHQAPVAKPSREGSLKGQSKSRVAKSGPLDPRSPFHFWQIGQ